jgi:hypothetical protein
LAKALLATSDGRIRPGCHTGARSHNVDAIERGQARRPVRWVRVPERGPHLVLSGP